MYKYIITWVVLSMQPVHCPDTNKSNEFGIKSNVSCAVNHIETVESKKIREFNSKDSAIYFIKRMNDYKHSGFGFYMRDEIKNIKIDSLKIK